MSKRTVPRRFSQVPPYMIGQLVKVGVDDVEGLTMRRAVLGRLPEKFCGRSVVLLKRVPGMFGSPCVSRTVLERHTLHRGIVNQMEITDRPSPYWAVLDAASELRRGFTDESVISMAIRTLRSAGVRKTEKELRRACRAAWATTKWHQNHPWKRTRGYGYIVDVWADDGMAIRARHPDETMRYFDMAAKRKMASARVARDPKARMPTEKCPIAVVVKPR